MYEDERDVTSDGPQRESRRGRPPRDNRSGPPDQDDHDEGLGGEEPSRGRRGRRKEDYFYANDVKISYKDVDTLRRFLSDRAKIRPRRQTGLTSKHQRMLAREIKRARHLALLPFTDEHTRG